MEEKEEKGGFDVEFVGNFPYNVTCCICLFVLREPMQAEQCGHRFCKSCITDLKNSSTLPLVCPEDRYKISVFHDRGKEREISNLIVSCSNKKHGCDWTDELLHLKNHLQCCRYQIVRCLNSTECEQALPRWQINNHMELKCYYRRLKCKFCESTYLLVEEELHSDVCEYFPMKCELCEQLEIPRCKMVDHLSETCPKKLHVCSFSDVGCEEKLSPEDLALHQSSAVEKHLALAMEIIREQDVKITELTSQMKVLSNTVSASKHAYEAFKNEQGIRFYPFQEKLQNAKDGRDGFTRRFFALDGYHCKVRVYLNGNVETKHKHISVDISIERGPFDLSVQWPMKAVISFGLLKNKVIKNQYVFNTNQPLLRKVFTKPGDVGCAGISLFLPHNSLHSFVANDSLTFIVNIEPFIKNPPSSDKVLFLKF